MATNWTGPYPQDDGTDIWGGPNGYVALPRGQTPPGYQAPDLGYDPKSERKTANGGTEILNTRTGLYEPTYAIDDGQGGNAFVPYSMAQGKPGATAVMPQEWAERNKPDLVDKLAPLIITGALGGIGLAGAGAFGAAGAGGAEAGLAGDFFGAGGSGFAGQAASGGAAEYLAGLGGAGTSATASGYGTGLTDVPVLEGPVGATQYPAEISGDFFGPGGSGYAGQAAGGANASADYAAGLGSAGAGYTYNPATDSFGPGGSGYAGQAASGGVGAAGLGGVSTAAQAGTALSRLLAGNPTPDDLASLAGKVAPALLGAYASNQQTGALSDLAAKQEAAGAPSRARYEASMTPGFDPTTIPGYQGALDTTSQTLLRKLSATGGNPYGNPGGMIEANKQIISGTALPAIQNYQNQNANTGGLGQLASAAPQTAAASIGASADVLGDLGGAFKSVTNPQTSLDQILKQLAGKNLNTGVAGLA